MARTCPRPATSSNVDRLVRIWTANADGTNARVRGRDVRAGEVAWFPDGQRLLFAGRDQDGGSPGIYTLDLTSGTLTRVVEAFSPRAVRLAPDGQSLVYLAALEVNPDANGLFLVRLDTGERRKLPLLGGVRWLPDSSGLIALPTQTDGGADALVRVDAATLGVTPLTDRVDPALPGRAGRMATRAGRHAHRLHLAR